MSGRGLQGWLRWLGRTPPLLVDSVLALAMVVVIVPVMQNDAEPGGRALDVVGYGIGTAPAALVFARRRWPLATLLLSTLTVFGYHALEYPPISFAMPLAVAVYTAAAGGWAALTLTLVAVSGLGTVLVRVLGEGERLVSAAPDSLSDTALLAAMAFWGLAVRNRRAYQAEARQRLRLAELEREREAQQRVTQERLRIARELHDVLAHTVTVISVQTGVAAELVRDRPEEAEASLRAVRAASKQAVTEIRAAVGMLREGGPAGAAVPGQPAPPVPGIDQLGDLAAQARSGGLRVELNVAGQPRPLPPAVDLTAYRIVQESLTNVQRHAAAATAAVTVTFLPDAVEVEVRDDGRGPRPPTSGATSGFGVAGMRERATALGGRLEAGAAPDGGFRVHAWLPADRGAAAAAGGRRQVAEPA